MSSGLLQVFLVEVGILHGTSNHVFYLIQVPCRLAPEFDKKHLKKAEGQIVRNIVTITIKKKTIVRKSWLIKLNKLRLWNSDN